MRTGADILRYMRDRDATVGRLDDAQRKAFVELHTEQLERAKLAVEYHCHQLELAGAVR